MAVVATVWCVMVAGGEFAEFGSGVCRIANNMIVNYLSSSMKRYNIINNSLGWLCFVIAAVTYLLTIEPTASFWDCPEFISQGFKLEVGHPPGNPIFMLTARFFVTLFGGEAQDAAIAVNSMSALLSAGTILLLFWTITHLVRRLTVRDDASEVSPVKTAIIMGAGLCGALVYTWSDTFWFSAVEGEVYAFSSFCTALVIWLIFKWENRADQPHSDRYLVLIAYVIGISIAVHLLNLLCIPAIVLVVYYRKFKKINLKGSLIALVVSAVLVGLILYGLVPGFMKVAQGFELLFVNVFGFSYNTGVLCYAILLIATFVVTIYLLHAKKSAVSRVFIRIMVFLSVILSGMPFIGHSWLIPTVLIIALGVYLFGFCRPLPVRMLKITILSIFVIFIGYSSYALLLIRANADTPMNQNSPDNVFALGSYLNREQYGDRPLFNGPVFAEEIKWQRAQDAEGREVTVAEVDENGYPKTKVFDGYLRDATTNQVIDKGGASYVKIAKTNPAQPDRYVAEKHEYDLQTVPEMNMLFTRIYSNREMHVRDYKSWSQYENPDFASIPASVRKEWAERGYVTAEEMLPYTNHTTSINYGVDEYGDPSIDPQTNKEIWKADFGTNFRYFINYQLNHMYWRYFMWNFAGRQNDFQGNGEPHLGNWISGISFIDNARLGDQSLLPGEYGEDNPGHNVFFMLPLLLGIFGLLWQALVIHRTAPERGIQHFWIVFFLFFMTGIAIVLYLNQTPGQPRERDYAFAGSFYAYAIWVGMGVPAIFHVIRGLLAKNKKNPDSDKKLGKLSGDELRQARLEDAWARQDNLSTASKWTAATIAIVIGILVPLQMVSQTWDDHDRSGRYTTRDFGMNYLNSLDDNAIIFVNGDNDTFPLWYAQEVEGCRTDVKVVNLSYLATDWYANQIRSASYEAKGVPMFANPEDYAYDKLQFINLPATQIPNYRMDPGTVTIQKAMSDFYGKRMPGATELAKYYGNDIYPFTYPSVIVPLDAKVIKSRFGCEPQFTDSLGNAYMEVGSAKIGGFSGGLNDWLTYDIITSSMADNFKRPVYIASTVGENYYPGWVENTFGVGMAYQVLPFDRTAPGFTVSPVAAKAYDNIVGKFRWGGLDTATPGSLYLDETVRHMVTSTRRAIITAVDDLMAYGKTPAPATSRELSKQKGLSEPRTYLDMAVNLLDLMQKKLPGNICPYESMQDVKLAEGYIRLGLKLKNKQLIAKGRELCDMSIKHYAPLVRYALGLAETDPDFAAKLGTSDTYNVRYNMAQIIGLLNTANIGEAIIDKPIVSELTDNSDQSKQLDFLADITAIDADSSLRSMAYAFYFGLSDDDVAKALSQFDMHTAQMCSSYVVFAKTYGIDRTKVLKDVAKKTGLSVDDIKNAWLF